MFCGQCGAQVDDRLPFCDECGAPLSTDSDIGEADAEVFPLLAAANLARMRGDFDEASTRCIEVLRRFPNNASAHSLMGDIYREQGQPRDAIEWYKLALELNPRGQSDRVKLEELLDQVYEAPEAPPEAVRAGWDAVQERFGISRAMAIGGLAAILVLVVAVGGVYLWRLSINARVERAAAQPRPSSLVSGNTQTPPRPDRATVAPPQPPPEGSVRDWVEQTPTPEPKPTPLSEEGRLREHLSGALPSTAWVETAFIDPRDHSVEITAQVRVGETAGQTRDRIRAMLPTLVEGTRRAVESLSAIRLKVYVVSADEKNPGVPDKAFVADWRGVDLGLLPAVGVTPDDLLTIAQSPWWHPTLVPGTAPS